ncbi:cytochrome c [Sulfuriferula sp.]|uniref:c-type cytochrome n=1 Tax=Sulfuriferula sp. TaxID=2025307 RepID=UPI0027302FEB|nr:cytochrome c [Sulfuriferula sp.]MDP2027975.1 cytochrome c [Sulfuriferula sp.]
MKTVKIILAMLLFIVLGIGLFVWSGIYNPGADSPHWKITYALMQTTRERAIEQRAATITLPTNLNDAQLILKGAGQYAAMCTSCHLAPGMKDSELRPGLYPLPPNLSQVNVDPREAFWVIKHGMKMSAMPAWGASHDDATIWSMVAFLQKLPTMTPAQYKEMVAKAPPDDDMGPMDSATMPAAQGHNHDSSSHSGH